MTVQQFSLRYLFSEIADKLSPTIGGLICLGLSSGGHQGNTLPKSKQTKPPKRDLPKHFLVADPFNPTVTDPELGHYGIRLVMARARGLLTDSELDRYWEDAKQRKFRPIPGDK